MAHHRSALSLPATTFAVCLWLLALAPTTTRGQVPAGSLSLALLDGVDLLEGSRWAPGLAAEVDVVERGAWSFGLLGLVARRDFTLEGDELHRNYGAAAVGARWTLDRAGPTLAVGVKVGVFVADDESETDPRFRSSGNYEEMVVPGIEVRWPQGESWGVVFAARDLWTGWWWALIDPDESASTHRLLLSVGVFHR